MKPTIRELQKNDIDQVLELYAQPEMDNGNTLSQSQALAMLSKFESYPFYRFYVAETGTRLVGVFGLLIMDNLGHQGAKSGVVEGVCVAPHEQGKGTGKAMMEYAMLVCKQYGCYKLTLSSNQRRAAAHEFYRKLGFHQHGFSFHISL